MEKERNNMSKLNDGLKKNPFSTPDDYFEQLPSLIQERCAKPESERKGWRILIPQAGLVMGFVLLAFFAKGILGLVGQKPDKQQGDMVAMQDSTIGTYADDGFALPADSVMVDEVIVAYLLDRNISDMDIALSNQ